MIKLIQTILVGIFIYAFSYSQSCIPEGITLYSQQQIDDFKNNFPDCIKIEGNLFIKENPSEKITNLSGLSHITSIGGTLGIWFNDSLSNLEGLNNLSFIGGNLRIYNNPNLTSLSGLENVDSIIGGLEIANNKILTNFSRFKHLSFIGDYLFIRSNEKLTNLLGLEKITTIGGEIDIFHNNQLKSLIGLDNLITIDKSLSIWANDSLTTLSGLEKIYSIGGSLFFRENPVLVDLSGLKSINVIGGDFIIFNNFSLNNILGLRNLTSINGRIEITNNHSLSMCSIQSICDILDIPDKSIIFHNNLSGCNSKFEVKTACKSSTYNLEFGNINIYPNPTEDNFIVDFSDTKFKQVEITLFDVSGKQQLNFKKKKSVKILKVESEVLNAGLYIIRIKSEKLGTSYRKVILSK